jgi:hypothetical protein
MIASAGDADVLVSTTIIESGSTSRRRTRRSSSAPTSSVFSQCSPIRGRRPQRRPRMPTSSIPMRTSDGGGNGQAATLADHTELGAASRSQAI